MAAVIFQELPLDVQRWARPHVPQKQRLPFKVRRGESGAPIPP